MAIVRIGGPGSVNLPTFPGLQNNISAVGVPGQSGYYTGLTNAVTLAASEIWNIPSGTWWVAPGPYTFLQWQDPVTGNWRTRPTAATGTQFVNSDGSNFRLANLTGCVVGAAITTGTATGSVNGIGTAINLVSCAPSSGASTWQTIVGGAIASTLATSTGTTTAGSGYTYIPVCVIDAPPTGGLQATAIVTSLSSGTIPVANIQVINQGAGYSSAPNVTFINDPRDTAGSGAVVVTTLTATGQLTGLYPINHGTALTGVPTFTFALTNGTAVSCNATAIMNFTVTAYLTATTIGSSIGNATITSNTNLVAGQTTPVVNPLHAGGVTFPRPCRITAGISGGTVLVAGAVVEDGGLGIQGVPNAMISYTITSTTAVVPQMSTLAVGGVSDTSLVQPV